MNFDLVMAKLSFWQSFFIKFVRKFDPESCSKVEFTSWMFAPLPPCASTTLTRCQTLPTFSITEHDKTHITMWPCLLFPDLCNSNDRKKIQDFFHFFSIFTSRNKFWTSNFEYFRFEVLARVRTCMLLHPKPVSGKSLWLNKILGKYLHIGQDGAGARRVFNPVGRVSNRSSLKGWGEFDKLGSSFDGTFRAFVGFDGYYYGFGFPQVGYGRPLGSKKEFQHPRASLIIMKSTYQ